MPAIDFGARRITISTSGLVPKILQLADEDIGFRLAISLHGATDEVREAMEISFRQQQFNPNLYRSVEELELSVRSANCLQNANIKYIYELVQKTEAEMLKTKNFGRKSLNEIKEVLSSMGLRLGMDIPGWPPENIEEMAKKLEQELLG